MQDSTAIPRPEHPRPDFMRDGFENLNGRWQFAYDDADEGIAKQWYQPGHAFPMTILVPFAYQSKASGIHDAGIHPVLWYRRSFRLPNAFSGQRTLLCFGAVDYACLVFVNGQKTGEHTGGYTPFAMDITPYLIAGENDLCVRVVDQPDRTQPRGKQYWDEGAKHCWYMPCSGIWQTVYLETVGDYAIKQAHITPDIDNGRAYLDMALDHMPDKALSVEVAISFQGKPVRKIVTDALGRNIHIPMDMASSNGLMSFHLWYPGSPNLYDVSIRLRCGDVQTDHVKTYFGMRKIECVNGQILLNNTPIYQRLILDQGYWPDTLLTPPSDEAIRRDVELTLAMGFNGARKHEKIEDPRYYYWADRLGLLVWGEVPSLYEFSRESIANLSDTLGAFINRDFNHPSVIVWVPLNESWGVPQMYANKRQQETGRMLYHYAKAADGTRLVSANDGWEQVTTDICAVHDYTHQRETLEKRFASRTEVEQHACGQRMCYARGESPTGKEAFMITEFGGIAIAVKGQQDTIEGVETWGYYDKVPDKEAFASRFSDLLEAILALPYNQGYCYTQLTDVIQEVNGLLTPAREPKLPIDVIRGIVKNPLGRIG